MLCTKLALVGPCQAIMREKGLPVSPGPGILDTVFASKDEEAHGASCGCSFIIDAALGCPLLSSSALYVNSNLVSEQQGRCHTGKSMSAVAAWGGPGPRRACSYLTQKSLDAGVWEPQILMHLDPVLFCPILQGWLHACVHVRVRVLLGGQFWMSSLLSLYFFF